MQNLRTKTHPLPVFSQRGVAIAVLIIALWLASLLGLLALEAAAAGFIVIAPAIALRAFLHTGLFITAHEAMHGLLAPRRKKLNDFLGGVCVLLYALFSFDRLRAEHRKHHAQPGGAHDPDFHDGEHKGFWPWYFHFMRHYVTWRQIAGMALAFNLLHHALQAPIANLLLFWVAPALLSTLQLFYFGTFLPHRETEAGYRDRHRARSNDFSVWWSFCTCYHFGYHWEHHRFPHVPWWRLPRVRKEILRREARAQDGLEPARQASGTRA